MRIQLAGPDDKATLLDLMRESYELETAATATEWAETETAIANLLDDAQAGEAYLIVNEDDVAVGYMILCRGFSLYYGGYFTWVEETYLREADRGRFRDRRFSP